MLTRYDLEGSTAQDTLISIGDTLHKGLCSKNEIERKQMNN